MLGCTKSASKSPSTSGTGRGSGDIVDVTLLQMNDVYEITPVAGGTEGGLARVATLRNQRLKENPNTFTILAGDLLSPSALGTAMVDGQRLAGKQMVDVMNAAGLNYATFGNHEFDLSRDQLTQRLAESKFTWFSSNVTDAQGQALPNVPINTIFTAKNSGGKTVRIGLFGVTINSNPTTYVAYRDPIAVAREQVAALRNQVDVLVAVTHLNLATDVALAQEVPGIDLILGGHEHENDQVDRGANFTPIFKADANARSVYVHELRYNTASKKLETDSRLQPITSQFPDDPKVAAVVQRWVDAAYAGFRAQGFDPTSVVSTTSVELDGSESSVRNKPTALTDLVARGMLHAAPGTEVAIFNSGSIRIDDVLPPGKITQYDVIRTLPFGDTVLSADIQGSVLQRVLDQGQANAGTGGYLQTAGLTRNPGGTAWLVNGAPLRATATYKVAINSFLLTGKEMHLDYLARTNPDISNVVDHDDIRKAMIAELQR
jgi:5'-nucleotidase